MDGWITLGKLPPPCTASLSVCLSAQRSDTNIGLFVVWFCSFLKVTVTSLVVISLNRYLRVCHPRLYNRVFTLPRTVVICIAIWLSCSLLALPPLWGTGAPAVGSYRYGPATHFCSFSREGLTYPKVMVVLFSTVPVLLVGYWNLAIFRSWKRARMAVASRYPLTGRERKRLEKLVARWRAGFKKGREEPAEAKQQKDEVPQCPPKSSPPQPGSQEQQQLGRTVQSLREKRARKDRARAAAFVRSLLLVSVLMLVSFVPFGVVIVVTSSSYVTASPEVVIAAYMLLFFSSSVNCVVYGAMNPRVTRSCRKNVRYARQVLRARRQGRAPPEVSLHASQRCLIAASSQRINTE